MNATYLMGEELKSKILKTSKAMPPMPQILAKATRIIHDETKGFKEIGDVLETDQAMATRVLRIANSPYSGLSIPVSSVQQASALLGSQTLLELITIVSTSKIMGQSLPGYGFSSTRVWRHTLAVAAGSKIIAEKHFPDIAADAFNAGLIHDCGMIILDEYMAERKASLPGPPSPDESILIDMEKQIFGFDHAEIAAVFLAKWNLPAIQTNAIRFHHAPAQAGGDILTDILHAAECIAQYGQDAEQALYLAKNETFTNLGMDRQALAEIYGELIEAVDNIVASVSR